MLKYIKLKIQRKNERMKTQKAMDSIINYTTLRRQ